MNYSVEELRKKFDEKISSLGVSPKFKENPAYASVLAEMDSLISQMNMGEVAEAITVKETGGGLSFSWNSNFGEKYSMSISSSNPGTFRCVTVEEKKPFVSASGKMIKRKSAVEKVATIDEAGTLTLTENISLADNSDCDYGACNISNSAEKKCYTPNGVMKERETKNFSRMKIEEDFDRTDANSMLSISRKAFDIGGFWSDRYATRTLLTREKLDTARVVKQDQSKGIIYIASTPLNQEHGLRDMALPNGYGLYPQEVIIPSLSKEQIEAMIQRESDTKVAEGLREYATGRENYYYDSKSDKNFISQGIEQEQSFSQSQEMTR